MKFCFLGDSLTQGYPFTEEYSWTNIVSAQLDVKIINRGVCGETAADFVARMDAVLADENITHLVIFGGFNDIGEQRPLRFIVADLQKCGEIAAAKGICVAYVLPYLPNESLYLQTIIHLRDEMKAAFGSDYFLIDLQAKDFCQKIPSLDGLHPTIEGYKTLAKIALPQIKLWLKN